MRYVAGSGGGGCFPAGSLVMTPDGVATIESLRVGDEVLSFDAKGKCAVSKVTVVHTHPADDILRVNYWGGSIRITANHWVLNQYGTFAAVGTLTEHDAMVDSIGHLRPVLSIEPDGVEPVFNLTVFPNHTFIADGIRVHNGGRGLTRPVVGSGGGGKGSGGESRTAIEDPDSLQSHQYAKIIDLLSEGPIGGLVDGMRSVFLNETPIVSDRGTTNFTGVRLNSRNGTNNQTVIPGFADVESETAVNTEIVYGVPVTRHVPAGADAVRITVGIPTLTKQDITNGDLHGTSVQLSVSVDNNGGGFQPVSMRYEWQSASPSGDGIVAYNAYGAYITANLSFPENKVTYMQGSFDDGSGGILFRRGYSGNDGDDGSSQPVSVVPQGSFGIYQTQYAPLTYRVEYAAPGGGWTLLAREIVPSGGKASLSRSYQTPSGALGTWQMRVVVEPSDPIPFDRVVILTEAGGSVSSVSGYGLRLVSNDIISGKTTSRYKRSYYIPLPAPGPWEVKVTRDTPTVVDSSLRNQTWWDSMTEIVESKLSYPNSAIVGAVIDAEQFSDIPSRGYEIYGILCKVPSNYDPIYRKYTGLWNGTFVQKWTDNPVWIYYDLLTSNRYGLGDLIDSTGLDKWALYEIARYCDEPVPSGFGYLEPRFTCNCYIQAREDAYKLLTNMTSVFRGMAYWSAGQVTASCDMPSDPVALFANANVIDGVFTYSGSGRGARHTVALVTWNDPSDMFRQKVEYVDDIDGIKTYGVNQTEVVAFGCTSKGQAHRLGKWILYSERLETETVSFKTGLEGVSVYPGAIIKVADNLRSGDRIGGRILDATIDSVTLDQTVTIAPNTTYTLSVVMPEGATITHPDGSTSTSKGGDVVDHIVTTTFGDTTTLSVTPAFATPPQKHAMWILASANLEPQTFRVLSVSEADNMQIEVTALQHDPHKYDMIEYDREFPEPLISSISATAPTKPTLLDATDTLYLQGPGVVGTKCHFSWQSKAARYEVKWKQSEGNYQLLSSFANSVDIAPVVEGAITLQVRGIDTLGRFSEWAALNYVVLGKTIPPAEPTGLTASITDAGIVLSWTANTELDFSQYEIQANGVLADTVLATQWTYPSTPLGLTNFSIFAVDTTGNKSTAATASTTIVPPGAPSLSYSFSANQVVLSIAKPASQLSIDHYEVRRGKSWEAGVSMGKAYSTTFSILGAWVGARTFWVAATDVAAHTGAAQSIPVTIIAPCAPPSMSLQVIDNNVLIYWGESTGSLPVDTYEIRRGSTWATADVIGKKSGGFTTVFETVAGIYDYLVAAIDTAGNYGPHSLRAATVSQPPDYLLKVSTDSIFDGAFSNAKLDADNGILLPLNLTETFQQHFTGNGWAAPQEQVSAGFPIYAQPGALSGYYEEVIDLGAILAAMKITLSYSGKVVAGSPVIITTISTKRLVGDAWTDNVGVDQFYGSNFQFVKVRIAVSGAAGTLYRLRSINTKLDAKLKSDAGMTACLATDTLGTITNFTIPFIDVTAINVSPAGTTPCTVVYDFRDAADNLAYSVTSNVATITHTAHPYVVGQKVRLTIGSGLGVADTYTISSITANSYTFAMTAPNTSGTASVYAQSMRLYLFNQAGARINGTVSWNAKGY